MNDNSEFDASVQVPVEAPKVSAETIATPPPTRESGILGRLSGIFNRNKSDSHQAIAELANVDLADDVSRIEPENVQEAAPETSLQTPEVENPDPSIATEDSSEPQRKDEPVKESDARTQSEKADAKMANDDVKPKSAEERLREEVAFGNERSKYYYDNANYVFPIVRIIEERNRESRGRGGKLPDYREAEYDERISEVINSDIDKPEVLNKLEKTFNTYEDLLSKQSQLPQLSDLEQQAIQNHLSILREVRKRFEDKGIHIAAFDNSTKINTDALGDGDAKSIDPETASTFAYHASSLVNLPSIAEAGLQPSNKYSKEPGTIFFNPHAMSGQYLGAMDILYRTPLSNIEESREMDDYKIGAPIVSTVAIPLEALEYSIDYGKTWRKDMSIFREKTITDSGVASSPE